MTGLTARRGGARTARPIGGGGRLRGGLAALALLATLVGNGGGKALAVAPPGKVDELGRALMEDSNYKVRVQAALVLGKLRDPSAVPALIQALKDQNQTVRAIAAQALGQIADQAAGEPLRALLKRETDAFVRKETEKALALLGKKHAKIYLNIGQFTVTVKTATADDARIIHDAVAREMGKLQLVTLVPPAGDPKTFTKSGLLGFRIDGVISRLDDVATGGGSETTCDVMLTMQNWPNNAILGSMNAGTSVQSGSRASDKVNARRECLEASAVQLSEDLSKFFKSQGG